MAAMRRDTANNFETLLVAVNPNDRHYFCHQTNSLPVAKAKGMGLIGMKVFADGVMYGLERKFAGSPGQSVPTVGRKDKVPFEDFLRYTLSAPGMSTLIAGIGLSDKNNDPQADQLVADLAACQAGEPLVGAERRQIEDRVAALHGTETNFFQRTSSGFVAPRNVRLESAADSRAKLLGIPLTRDPTRSSVTKSTAARKRSRACPSRRKRATSPSRSWTSTPPTATKAASGTASAPSTRQATPPTPSPSG